MLHRFACPEHTPASNAPIPGLVGAHMMCQHEPSLGLWLQALQVPPALPAGPALAPAAPHNTFLHALSTPLPQMHPFQA